jgi:hypothetical protein
MSVRKVSCIILFGYLPAVASFAQSYYPDYTQIPGVYVYSSEKTDTLRIYAPNLAIGVPTNVGHPIVAAGQYCHKNSRLHRYSLWMENRGSVYRDMSKYPFVEPEPPTVFDSSRNWWKIQLDSFQIKNDSTKTIWFAAVYGRDGKLKLTTKKNFEHPPNEAIPLDPRHGVYVRIRSQTDLIRK